jgi:hypothetical protein
MLRIPSDKIKAIDARLEFLPSIEFEEDIDCPGSYEARASSGSRDGIGYDVKDAKKWEVDPERTASKFDAGYYRGCWRMFGKRQRHYSIGSKSSSKSPHTANYWSFDQAID